MLVLARKNDNARLNVSKQAIFLAIAIATAQELKGKKFGKQQFKELLRVGTILLEQLKAVILNSEIREIREMLTEIDKHEGITLLNANATLNTYSNYVNGALAVTFPGEVAHFETSAIGRILLDTLVGGPISSEYTQSGFSALTMAILDIEFPQLLTGDKILIAWSRTIDLKPMTIHTVLES